MCIANRVAATTCASPTDFVPFRAAAPWRLEPGSDGPRRVFVWLRNAAGYTTLAPAVAAVDADFNAPEYAAVVVARRAPYVASPVGVRLDVTALDPSGLARYCFDQRSGGGECAGAWAAFQDTVFVDIDAGRQGAQRVRVFLEDGVGHRTPPAGAAIGSITLDSAPPSMAAVRPKGADVGRGGVRVRWTGAAADAAGGSGVAGYLAACCALDGAPPPDACAADAARGVAVASASGAGAKASPLLPPLSGARMLALANVTLPRAGKPLSVRLTLRYRVCAFDAAGNVAPGVVGSQSITVKV